MTKPRARSRLVALPHGIWRRLTSCDVTARQARNGFMVAASIKHAVRWRPLGTFGGWGDWPPHAYVQVGRVRDRAGRQRREDEEERSVLHRYVLSWNFFLQCAAYHRAYLGTHVRMAPTFVEILRVEGAHVTSIDKIPAHTHRAQPRRPSVVKSRARWAHRKRPTAP